VEVPPNFRDFWEMGDGGMRVQGDAQGGHVEVPPNFRYFWEMGDGGVDT
jgi:hypothetical protein